MSNQDFDPSTMPGPSNLDDGLSASDTYVETSSKSWFERILDSLKAIVFGLLLVIVSAGLMFWNEGRSAKTAAALAEGAGLVISVRADAIDPAREGKLIHVSGPTTEDAGPRDADFGFEAASLKLDRLVEMYQWKEESQSETRKKLGGGEETVTRYTYSRDWVDHAMDSDHFRDGAGHRNPAMPKLASRSFFPSAVKLGAFSLNENVLRELPATDSAGAPDSALERARALLGPRASIRAGTVYAGANPDQPAVGDVRVTWRSAPVGEISLVGRQTQSTLSQYLASNRRELLLVEPGIIDAGLMFKHGEDENSLLTWVLRAVGAVLMFIGFRVMLSLIEVLADIIPFLGSIVGAGASFVALICTLIFAPLIVAIAWIFYRPFVAISVLAVGAVLLYGVRMLAVKRVARFTQPASGPSASRP